MDLVRFRQSLEHPAPPVELPLALQGMWWDAKGKWEKAHECAQAQEDQWGDWVHAYLHRKEGDMKNAGYWYRRAARPMPEVTLEAEWTDIVGALIASSGL